MSKFEKGWRGALMGLGAYLIAVLMLTIVLLLLSGSLDFFAMFGTLAVLDSVIGFVFVMVGAVVAVNKSPREAVRPLIITSVIVLVAVGGCFGLLGIY